MLSARAILEMLKMVPSVIRGSRVEDIEQIKRLSRATFPAVEQITTEELCARLESSAPPLLIDVRAAEEFAVSHLRGAINATRKAAITSLLPQKEYGCVLYCSVGFRSSMMAHALSREGYSNVHNLEGSIFAWANEGRPLFAGAQSASVVHPYGHRWAGLLRPGLASTAH